MRAAAYPRLRPDLTWRRFVSEGTDSYIFKDEISQEYVKLDVISGSLALRLDGKTSPEELMAWAQATWPGLDFDLDYIADVLADLKRHKFIEDPFERNALLRARAREERAQINSSTLKNIFSIPLGTLNPDRFLTRTYPYIAWFFSPVFVALGLLVFLGSLYLVVLNRDHFAGQTTSLLTGSGLRGWGALLAWITIIFVIVVHELGHGYCIKHFGGKVDKMGFIFIYGTPCMFCNTSDSHLFPNWKHRAYVALAGTYTELYVAALATLIWWATPSDTIVNQLAYNVMLFASVSGFIFNYNPLIKWDGYFVLADSLDMPNLQEDAYEYLGHLFRRHVMRMRGEPCPAEGRRRKRVLLIYAVLSILYSIAFTLAVFQVLRFQLIENFAFAGALVAALLLVIVLRSIARPLVGATRAWALDHRGQIRRHQLPIVAGMAALLGGFLLVPVPGRRAFDITIEPMREAALVAPEDLRLERAAWSAGQPVAAEQVLAVLDADQAEAQASEAAAEAGALHITGAVARRSGEARDAVTADAGQLAARQRSQLLTRRVRRAELRAPFAGRVMTAANPGRQGELFEAGDTLCVVGDFSQVRATARLWEFDLEDVRRGAQVHLRLRARPGDVLHGRVSAIQPAAERHGTRRLYQVRIALSEPPQDPRAGLTGKAWVATPWRPPAAHLYRALARFVRLDLWV